MIVFFAVSVFLEISNPQDGLTYVESEKGKKKLCLDGNLYIKDKTMNNKIYWKCERCKKIRYSARVITMQETLLKLMLLKSIVLKYDEEINVEEYLGSVAYISF